MSAASLAAIALAASRLMRERRTPPFTIMIVTFIACSVLVMSAFRATGEDHRSAVSVGLWGGLSITMLWIALRWKAADPEPRGSLREPLQFALIGAAALCAIATVVIATMYFSNDPDVTSALWVYPGYFAGAVAGSIVYWLLRPIAHRPLGRFLIGGVAGTCVYGAVAPVVILLNDEPVGLLPAAAGGIVLGFTVGPTVAFAWWDQRFAANRPPPPPGIRRRRSG